jgi:hypothetical protein
MIATRDPSGQGSSAGLPSTLAARFCNARRINARRIIASRIILLVCVFVALPTSPMMAEPQDATDLHGPMQPVQRTLLSSTTPTASMQPRQRDTSGHTRLKVFGGLYGAYLGIAVPVATQAEDAGLYALGLTFGPTVGLISTTAFSRGHGFSSGDAIALSSLTWFGAAQGHLWEAARDRHDDAGQNAAFGALGSLGGLLLGAAVSHNHVMSEGYAATLGAGNWWGMALGYLGARANEDASDRDKYRSAAIGSVTGLSLGALTGRGRTLDEVRAIHIGGILGWLYSAGLVVLQDPGQRGESLTQVTGIGVGMTAGFLAARFRPWHAPPELELDHSGRLRAQVFSILYGGYLATVIPLASDVEWWTEDTKDTYALAYMHGPPLLLLGTTLLTRTSNVSSNDVLTVSGLTWFGAVQGALWALTPDDAETRVVAATSAATSAAGLLAGTLVCRWNLSEPQAAMLGAGNWWGTALGYLVGGLMLGDDAEDASYIAAAAMGGIAGVVAGPLLGRHMSLRQVHTMHISGFAGWLVGAGSLLGGGLGFRAAHGVMAVATTVGLIAGARMEDGTLPSPTVRSLSVQPFVSFRSGLSGETTSAVGVRTDF